MERDNISPGFELDTDGIEIIPFDKSYHTGQGEYSGHNSVFIEGQNRKVHNLPNFPTQLNRFFDFLEGREPSEDLIDNITYQQFVSHSVGPALLDLSLQAPNLYKRVLIYREQKKNIAQLRARGPQNDEEKRILFALDEPQPTSMNRLSREEKDRLAQKHRLEAAKRLHYSMTYQLLGSILKSQDPEFDLRVLSR